MKCISWIRGSHLKKWLGFTRKCNGSHGLNRNGLFNGDELAVKGVWSCMKSRVHSKTGPLAKKDGRTASKTAKNSDGGGLFNYRLRAPRAESSIETLGGGPSVAWLPPQVARVSGRRQNGRKSEGQWLGWKREEKEKKKCLKKKKLYVFTCDQWQLRSSQF